MRALLALATACALVVPARAGERATRVTAAPPEMVRVPGGEFVLGIDEGEAAHYVRACSVELGALESSTSICQRLILSAVTSSPYRVTLSTFLMDRTEVSVAAYRACVRYGPCDARAMTTGDVRYMVDAWPMTNVTYDDAATYCAYRGKRLPTEAEWERAARGDDGRRWPWGAFDRVDGANRGRLAPRHEIVPGADVPFAPDDRDGYRELAPVGALRYGASPYGIVDLAGNVEEWVDGFAAAYDLTEVVNPQGARAGGARVVRGGNFFEPGSLARTYYRGDANPIRRSITRGFRCARSLDPDNPTVAPAVQPGPEVR